MQLDHNHFMDRAIALAQRAMDQGNGPAGCVIAIDGSVVSEGHNVVNSHVDPTAHAELIAIRNAAKQRGTISLKGCTLYSCIEPCPMCCWAIITARVSTLVLGARLEHFRRRDLGTYSVEALSAMTGQSLEIITGVREQECKSLQYEAIESCVRRLRQTQKAPNAAARSTPADLD